MKVLFNIPKQTVSIEGDGPDLIKLLEVVREVAPNLPEITIQAQGISDKEASPAGTANNGGGLTLRQFTRKISLGSNSEKIAAVAYYKKDHEALESFTPKEMGEWFTNCGFNKPSQMPVAVHAARKRYGYVESESRGRWRLTTNGLNLIVGKLNDRGEDE